MPLVIIPQIQCKLAERPTGALAAWRGASPDLGESEEGGSLECIPRAAPQRREKDRRLCRPSAWSVIAGTGNRDYVSHWGLYNIDGSYWSFPSFCQVTLQTTSHINQSLCLALQEKQLEGLTRGCRLKWLWGPAT